MLAGPAKTIIGIKGYPFDRLSFIQNILNLEQGNFLTKGLCSHNHDFWAQQQLRYRKS